MKLEFLSAGIQQDIKELDGVIPGTVCHDIHAVMIINLLNTVSGKRVGITRPAAQAAMDNPNFDATGYFSRSFMVAIRSYCRKRDLPKDEVAADLQDTIEKVCQDCCTQYRQGNLFYHT